MTEKRLRELFTLWQSRLGLDHWEIEVIMGDVGDDGAYMDCHRSVKYNRARIHVQPWVLSNKPPNNVLIRDFTPQVIETSAVHELLHCSTLHMTAMVQDDLDGQLHRDAFSMFDRGFDRQVELYVENLSQALVRNWPK